MILKLSKLTKLPRSKLRSKKLLSVLFSRRIIYLFLIYFSLIALFPISEPSGSYAGTALAISPASGTFSESIFVDVLVGTDGAPVTNLEINIIPTGPIVLTSSSPGDLGCTPVITVNGSGYVNIVCTATSGSLSNSGNMANLTFSTTGNGAAGLNITVVNTDGTVDSIQSASYTIAGYSGTYNGGTYTGGGGLPNTGILDNEYLQYGILILLGGLIILGISTKRHLTKEENKRYDTTSMSDKLDV